jgi:hypothetical protein
VLGLYFFFGRAIKGVQRIHIEGVHARALKMHKRLTLDQNDGANCPY